MTTLSANQLPVPARGASRRSTGLRRAREGVIVGWLVFWGIFSIFVTGAIIFVLFSEAAKFFAADEISFVEFITGTKWNPLLGAEKHFGIWPLVCGTFLVTAIAMCVALPLGLITAIWLSEYAPPLARNTIKPVLEILAGIPTVVFGFFALTVITPTLQSVSEAFDVYNVASAGIAVGIMCLPIVTSLSEDALRAVPRSLREASYGLGATRFETSIRVVVPAALSGIVAAFLLAIARAVGETMIVALAAGSMPLDLSNMDLSNVDEAVTGAAQPMTGYIVQIFLGDVSNFGIEYLSSYAVAATLFVLTFGVTVIGQIIRIRYRQAYE